MQIITDDNFVKATIVGFIANLGDIFIHLTGFLILKTTTTAHYIARLIFGKEPITVFRWCIGEFTHIVAGSLIGVLLWLFYRCFGQKHPYFKGIAFSLTLWILHVVIIPNIINTPRSNVFRTEIEATVDLVSHLVYGIVAATFFKKWFFEKD